MWIFDTLYVDIGSRAGLGPRLLYSNDEECMHSQFKHDLGVNTSGSNKSSEGDDNQTDNKCRNGVMTDGVFVLAPEYGSLKLPNEFFNRSQEDRQLLLERIHRTGSKRRKEVGSQSLDKKVVVNSYYN